VNTKTGLTRESPGARFLEWLLIVLCVLQLPISFMLEDVYIVHNLTAGSLHNVAGSRMYFVPLVVIVALCLLGVRHSRKAPSFRKKFFWRTAAVSLVIFLLCHEINRSFQAWSWG
jgi:phosphoglycerol transferase MdoB-like AlkP superfamily enzyme